MHLSLRVARREDARDLGDDVGGLVGGEPLLVGKPVSKIPTAQSESALSGQMVQMLATGAWGTDTHGYMVPVERPSSPG